MPVRQVIVDGSNLATEGRSLPSLAQLDQAVREFLAENPDAQVTVVVDASFGHRIDPSELPMFEEAEVAGEVVSPPAGAIGRGDAFLLRIAEKTGATVLSNDSFQEFHGEHSWLFDDGRLIGGKPVPGVGWIFMPRAPVRGQKSREVVKEAKRKKRVEEAAGGAASAPATGLDLAASRAKGRGKKVDRAIARATEEAVEPKANGRRRRRGGTPPAEPVNEPLAFITFIAAHPLGSEVMGTVIEFSSHGAFVDADGVRCYLPLSAMGDPPPRRAREMVTKGEERSFVVQALDPQRRGVELALPGFARVAGGPTEETVEAEIHEKPAAPKRRRREKAEPVPAPLTAAVDGKPFPEVEAAGAKKTPAAKKASKSKEPAAKKTTRAKKVTRVDEVPATVPAAEPVVAEKPVAKRATGAAAKAGSSGLSKAAGEGTAGAPATKARAAPTRTTAAASKAPGTGPKKATRSVKKSAAGGSPGDGTALTPGTPAETEPQPGPPAKKATRKRATGTATGAGIPTAAPAVAGESSRTRRKASGSTAVAPTDERAEPATRAAPKKAAARSSPARAKRSATPPSNPN
jgi:hypothetical protein